MKALKILLAAVVFAAFMSSPLITTASSDHRDHGEKKEVCKTKKDASSHYAMKIEMMDML